MSGTIGECLASYMRKNQFSITDLADELKCSRERIEAIVHDWEKPSYMMMKKIRVALGMSPAEAVAVFFPQYAGTDLGACDKKEKPPNRIKSAGTKTLLCPICSNRLIDVIDGVETELRAYPRISSWRPHFVLKCRVCRNQIGIKELGCTTEQMN